MGGDKGAEWAKWDLHVHSPASFNWKGPRLPAPGDARETLVRQWIERINAADASVFAVMDYWHFDGYLALRAVSDANPTLLKKCVLPGIELRVQSPTRFRLNIHVIFSDRVPTQRLSDFKSRLEIQIADGSRRPLSDQSLREFARALRDDQLRTHSVNKSRLSDNDYAFQIGSQTCEVTLDSFRDAVRLADPNSCIVFQPWDTYNGLSKLEWQEHYTSAYELFSRPEVFECRGSEYRDAFVGNRTAGNASFFDGFWAALQGRARLAVRGSDAHKLGDYAVFPPGATTWINARATFSGLLQATKEPATRSWIGTEPPKLEHVRARPGTFISSIKIQRRADSTLEEHWFDGTELELNPDLLAVIGAKGSGKSALGDILGLLGDCSSNETFTFLTPDRFRNPKNNRSAHFEATLRWHDGTSTVRRLEENPQTGAPERVRYASQAYFERICASPGSEEFSQQIERVIFDYIPGELVGNSRSLGELLKEQETESTRRTEQLRFEIRQLNARILEEARAASESARRDLEGTLKLREDELKSLLAAEPAVPNLTQGEHAPKVAELRNERGGLNVTKQKAEAELSRLQSSLQSTDAALAAVRSFAVTATREIERIRTIAEQIPFDISGSVQITVTDAPLEDLRANCATQVEDLRTRIAGHERDIQKCDDEIVKLVQMLGDQDRATHEQQDKRDVWARDVKRLNSDLAETSSIAYMRQRLIDLDKTPERIAALVEQRRTRVLSVASELVGLRDSRRRLVEEAGMKIGESLPKDFAFKLVNDLMILPFHDRFFSLIKQSSGTFRGEDEGRRALSGILEAAALDDPENLVALSEKLETAVLSGNGLGQLETAARKGRRAEEILDLIYSLDFISPRFSLTQSGHSLTHLSPGQRGIILLLFYLLVEKTDIPLILDQPEENLDNETVYQTLVPAIKRAKQRRQIIIVTHNANIAICCDAQQILHAQIDKNNGYKISYTSGAIEDQNTNEVALNILEGAKPAFKDRQGKYHSLDTGAT